MSTANLSSQAVRVSLEFKEGFEAYGEGIDGYAATPYPDCTQEMTGWFAGWVAARNADLADQPGMRRCEVSVAGQPAYAGLFRSTCDAQLDAMERFPAAGRIDVQVLP